MNKVLEALQKPFPPEEHSHRNIRGRSEDWVEDHYLIQRLNQVCGENWEWECRSEGVTLGEPHVVWCRWALNILGPEGHWVTREGYGADSGSDLANALKGAASYAKRHAAKQFGIALECWITPTIKGDLVKKTKKALTTLSAETSDPAVKSALFQSAKTQLFKTFAQCGNEVLLDEVYQQISEENKMGSPIWDELVEFALVHNNYEKIKELIALNWSRWKGMLDPQQVDELTIHCGTLKQLYIAADEVAEKRLAETATPTTGVV